MGMCDAMHVNGRNFSWSNQKNAFRNSAQNDMISLISNDNDNRIIEKCQSHDILTL